MQKPAIVITSSNRISGADRQSPAAARARSRDVSSVSSVRVKSGTFSGYFQSALSDGWVYVAVSDFRCIVPWSDLHNSQTITEFHKMSRYGLFLLVAGSVSVLLSVVNCAATDRNDDSEGNCDLVKPFFDMRNITLPTADNTNGKYFIERYYSQISMNKQLV